jgi:hypothetical protein
MKNGPLCASLLTFVLALAGCGPKAAAPPPHATTANGAATASDQTCLLAGAEAYEGLTERAVAEPMAKLALEAQDAEVIARGCERSLNPEQIAALHEIFDRTSEAQNAPAFALAAVEGYRVLISAQARGASPIPIDVSLLDYAGFRYQAGASSSTPLWEDMREAAAIADLHWAAIAPYISDPALRERFAGEVTALHAAIQAQDVAAARRAATAELDDVDRLEQYFSARPQR